MTARTAFLVVALLASAFLSFLYANMQHQQALELEKQREIVLQRPIVISGQDVADRYQCTFCHMLETNSTDHVIDSTRNCMHCHKTKTHGYNHDQPVIRYYAPNFDRMANHLRADWMETYIKDPYYIRPQLREHMPTFEFEEGEIKAVVKHIMQRSDSLPQQGNPELLLRQESETHDKLVSLGMRTARRFWCFRCHEFTGLVESQTEKTGPQNTLTQVSYLAPDLQHSRDRLQPEAIVGMILNPQSYNPKTLKPKPYGLKIKDAEALAYLILHADLKNDAQAPPALEPFDVIETPEYKRDIAPLFRRYCEACHYPEDNDMMGTASGYAGAFGFPAKYLDLTSYEGVMKGGSTDGKHFYEVVIPEYKDSILLRRMHGSMTPKMPFGQKIPDGVVQTIENWVMQGAVGPPPEDSDEDD